MSSITMNEEYSDKLRHVDGQVRILDAAGRSLGYFLPEPEDSPYKSLEIPISEEELDRREAKGGGRSLAEIMADLEKLG